MIQREFRIFLASIGLYTRIPLGKYFPHSIGYMAKSTKYLPVVGWITGGVATLVYLAAIRVFPQRLSVLLSMAAGTLMTGALHEDGLADTFDGFGGGHTKERILQIMKDSSIGTYGTLGLVFFLLSKFLCLDAFDPLLMPAMLITGHGLSRMMTTIFAGTSHYIRDIESSKSLNMVSRMNGRELSVAVITGLLPFFLFPSAYYLFTLAGVGLPYLLFRRYVVKKLGGYTGDCLGATQQITELAFYLSALIVYLSIPLKISIHL